MPYRKIWRMWLRVASVSASVALLRLRRSFWSMYSEMYSALRGNELTNDCMRGGSRKWHASSCLTAERGSGQCALLSQG